MISVQIFITTSIPLILSTFGMLYLFYRKFHPWVSEGISVGFEPSREKHVDMIDKIYEDLEEFEDDSPSTPMEANNQGNNMK